MEQVAQRGCGFSILEDIQKPPRHGPRQLSLGSLSCAAGLDQISARDPFQLQPLCYSVIEKLSFQKQSFVSDQKK